VPNAYAHALGICPGGGAGGGRAGGVVAQDIPDRKWAGSILLGAVIAWLS
jgi:hypothetical protein